MPHVLQVHVLCSILNTPYCTDRELFWIKELGTAMPYGCNDSIKGVGNLSSPGCNEINVVSLFNVIPRTKRSRLITMIIQNPVFGISCIISMLVHSTSQCLTRFTNIQKFTECIFYAVNDIFSRTVQRVKRFCIIIVINRVMTAV
jgi:hypothetical protein